jgi:hypothetical protein
MDDPIVEGVRVTRRRILAECGNELKRLFERIRAAEELDNDRLVTLEEVQKRAREKRKAVRP